MAYSVTSTTEPPSSPDAVQELIFYYATPQFPLIYCQYSPTPARINVPPLHQRGAIKNPSRLNPFILPNKILYGLQKPGKEPGPIVYIK